MHAEMQGTVARYRLDRVRAADLQPAAAMSVVVVADVPRMLRAVDQLAGSAGMPAEPRLTQPAVP